MQTLVSRSTPSEIFILDTKIFTCSDPGVLHCVEESVIEMCSQVLRRPVSSTGAGSLSQSLTEPPALPRPVRLDPLSPEITPNSLCSLTGQSRLRILWFHLTVLLCFSFNLSLNNCSGRYPFPPYHWVSGSSPRGPRSSRVFCPTTLKTAPRPVGQKSRLGILRDSVRTPLVYMINMIFLSTLKAVNAIIHIM